VLLSLDGGLPHWTLNYSPAGDNVVADRPRFSMILDKTKEKKKKGTLLQDFLALSVKTPVLDVSLLMYKINVYRR
jgi:hypothetical protein